MGAHSTSFLLSWGREGKRGGGTVKGKRKKKKRKRQKKGRE